MKTARARWRARAMALDASFMRFFAACLLCFAPHSHSPLGAAKHRDRLFMPHSPYTSPSARARSFLSNTRLSRGSIWTARLLATRLAFQARDGTMFGGSDAISGAGLSRAALYIFSAGHTRRQTGDGEGVFCAAARREERASTLPLSHMFEHYGKRFR